MHQEKIENFKLRDLTSGQALRRYRRRLASYTVNKDAMLTTKFKLEVPAPVGDKDFINCQSLYNTIEGCEKGSLTYFLFSVILSGFKIFASAKEASNSLQQDAYDETAFKNAVITAFGAPLPNLTISNLIKRLGTNVRSTGGKDNSFAANVIVTEYKKSLCPKVPKEADSNRIDDFFASLAKELLIHFDSWRSLLAQPELGCQCVDRVLKNFGTFPNLFDSVTKHQVSLPPNSSIAYSASAPFFSIRELPPQIVPYAVIACILNYPEAQTEVDKSKFVKLHLTTNTASGLSWLFNKGLDLFRSETVESLCSLFDVPETKKDRIEQIKDSALAINPQNYFYKGKNALGYHDFRTNLAGKLDSWVTNYLKRLEELKDILLSFSNQLALPDLYVDGQDFLDQTDCNRKEIELLIERFNEIKAKSLDALQNMSGHSPQTINEDVLIIEECSSISNRLFAIKNQIENVLNQIKENSKDSPWKVLTQESANGSATLFEDWNSLKRLPKLNQLSGGVPKAADELESSLALLREISEASRVHVKTILQWAKDQGFELNVIAAIANKEQTKFDKHGLDEINTKELALRSVLHRVGNVIRKRSDECATDFRAWFKSANIFAEEKDFNKYFFNQLGSLYVSPYSKRRHDAYKLTNGLDDQAEEIFESLRQFYLQKQNSYDFLSPAFETLQRIGSLLDGLIISTLPQGVPQEIAQLHLTIEQEKQYVYEGLRLQMKQAYIEPTILAKAFNTYSSIISGCLIVLRRDRFYLRTKFSWVDNTALIYRPKTKNWKIPERYRFSEKWAPIFDSGVLLFKQDGEVDTLATFHHLCSTKKGNLNNFRELLHQLPHDWCYAIPQAVTGVNDKVDVLQVKKKGSHGTVLSTQSVFAASLARLVGPCSHKERLDDLLLNPKYVVGDMTLLLDQEIHQSYQNKQLELKPAATTFSLAVPITTPANTEAEKGTSLPFKRIVAIDQGETGFAYAVFDLSDAGNAWATPVSKGLVTIPSIRRLIKNVRHYRTSKQSVQKFSQRFDSSMFTLRENVAGDVCGAIAGLMSRFQAFPILERQVSNLASGGKQLELVYKMVNARFLSDNIPAHQSERTSWWYKADRWEYPGYYREVDPTWPKNKAKSIDGRLCIPLVLSPGCAVNAKWTSMICSHCGNNAFELIAQADEQKIKKIEINSNGEVSLFGKTIKLYSRPDGKESKKARRKNERAPWVKPLTAQSLSLKDFRKIVKANLRRAPKSLQSKDTTQSRYFCVFKDCDFHNRMQHADINAAINIGRRFLKTLIFKEKS